MAAVVAVRGHGPNQPARPTQEPTVLVAKTPGCATIEQEGHAFMRRVYLPPSPGLSGLG